MGRADDEVKGRGLEVSSAPSTTPTPSRAGIMPTSLAIDGVTTVPQRTLHIEGAATGAGGSLQRTLQRTATTPTRPLAATKHRRPGTAPEKHDAASTTLRSVSKGSASHSHNNKSHSAKPTLETDSVAMVTTVTRPSTATRDGGRRALPQRTAPRESDKAKATRDRLEVEAAEYRRQRAHDEKRRRERVEARRAGGTTQPHPQALATVRPATADTATLTTSWRRGQWDSEGWRVDTTIDRDALGISNDAACAQAARELRGSYEAREAASFDIEAFKALKMQVRLNHHTAWSFTPICRFAGLDTNYIVICWHLERKCVIDGGAEDLASVHGTDRLARDSYHT